MKPATSTRKPATHLLPKSSHSGSSSLPPETLRMYSSWAPVTAGAVTTSSPHTKPSSVLVIQFLSSKNALSDRPRSIWFMLSPLSRAAACRMTCYTELDTLRRVHAHRRSRVHHRFAVGPRLDSLRSRAAGSRTGPTPVSLAGGRARGVQRARRRCERAPVRRASTSRPTLATGLQPSTRTGSFCSSRSESSASGDQLVCAEQVHGISRRIASGERTPVVAPSPGRGGRRCLRPTR